MERGFKPRGFKTSGYKNLARSARNRVWNELCLFYGTITWNVVRRFQRPPEEETSFETTCYGLYFTHHITHFKLQSMLELCVQLPCTALYLSGQNKKGSQLNNESEKAFVKTKAYVCCQNKVSFFYSCTHFFRLNFLLVLSHVLLVDGVLLDEMFFKAVIQNN